MNFGFCSHNIEFKDIDVLCYHTSTQQYETNKWKQMRICTHIWVSKDIPWRLLCTMTLPSTTPNYTKKYIIFFLLAQHINLVFLVSFGIGFLCVCKWNTFWRLKVRLQNINKWIILMLRRYSIFNVKIKGSSSSHCDFDLRSHFLLELAQELDSGTSLLLDPNPKLEPWKNTLEKMGRFFK